MSACLVALISRLQAIFGLLESDLLIDNRWSAVLLRSLHFFAEEGALSQRDVFLSLLDLSFPICESISLEPDEGSLNLAVGFEQASLDSVTVIGERSLEAFDSLEVEYSCGRFGAHRCCK